MCLHIDYINVAPLKIIVCVSSKNGQIESKMACDNTQKSSMLLVRKLYMLMQHLGPLPDNVCLNMKLFYYDEGKFTLAMWHRKFHLLFFLVCDKLLWLT